MNIADSVDQLKKEIAAKHEQIRVLHLLAEKIPGDLECFPYGNYIDFNTPENREKVSEIMQAVGGGKWDKSISASDATKIDYESSAFSQTIKVRIWGAPPPPSCKIVETEEVVPPQPETRRMVRKLVCA